MAGNSSIRFIPLTPKINNTSTATIISSVGQGKLSNPGIVTFLPMASTQTPSVSGLPPTYVALPAQQIQNSVQQATMGQPAIQVPITQNAATLPVNYIIKQSQDAQVITDSSGVQTVQGKAETIQTGPNHSGQMSFIGIHNPEHESILKYNTDTNQQVENQTDQKQSSAISMLEKLIQEHENILKDNTGLRPTRNDVSVLPTASGQSAMSDQSPLLPGKYFRQTQEGHHQIIQIFPPAAAIYKKQASPALQQKNPIVSRLLSEGIPAGSPDRSVDEPNTAAIKPTQKDCLLRRSLLDGQTAQLPNIVRPDTPTKMCYLQNIDKPLMSANLVQMNVKEYPGGGFDIRARDVVCGLATGVKIKPGNGNALTLDSSVYWCNFCEHTSESKQEFLSHVMTHRFNCRFCKFQAYSRADVMYHCADSHPEFDASPWSYCSFLHDNLKISVSSPQAPTLAENISQEDDQVEDGVELDMEVEEEGMNIQEDVSNYGSKPSKSDCPGTTVEHSCVSWNCSYCDFVSQKYELVKVHSTIMHQGLEVSAAKVKVSGDLAMQVNKLDTVRELHLGKGQEEFLQSGYIACPQNTAVKIPKTERLEAVIPRPNIKKTLVHRNVHSYECYHCHGQTLKLHELGNHLREEHNGDVFVGIDLRAIRLKKARFIVFCAIPGCDFFTKKGTDYVEHYKMCCSDWETTDDITDLHRSSIQDTITFATKQMKVSLRGKPDHVIYTCRYCDYSASSVGPMKTHNMVFHKTEKTCYYMMKNTKKGQLKTPLFFCRRCPMFMSKAYSGLQDHLKECHRPESHSKKTRYSSVSQGIKRDLAAYTDVQVEEKSSSVEEESLADRTRALGQSLTAFANVKQKDRMPRLYQCRVCKDQCLGVTLMKAHIQKEHPSSDLVATDVKRRQQHQSAVVNLCPQPNCNFCHKSLAELQEHCLTEHNLFDITMRDNGSRLSKSKYPPSFQCLYCPDTHSTNSPQEMKEHITKFHPGEMIVMRDVVARKLRTPSRIYYCDMDLCHYQTRDYNTYIKHVQKHAMIKDLQEESEDANSDIEDKNNHIESAVSAYVEMVINETPLPDKFDTKETITPEETEVTEPVLLNTMKREVEEM